MIVQNTVIFLPLVPVKAVFYAGVPHNAYAADIMILRQEPPQKKLPLSPLFDDIFLIPGIRLLQHEMFYFLLAYHLQCQVIQLLDFFTDIAVHLIRCFPERLFISHFDLIHPIVIAENHDKQNRA